MNKKWIALAGAILMAGGAFMPVFKVNALITELNVSYYDKDGLIVIIAAVIAAIVAFFDKIIKIEPLFGIVGIAVPIYDYMNLKSQLGNNSMLGEAAQEMVSLGIGFFVILLGAVILIIAPFINIGNTNTPNTSAQ